MRRGCGWEAWYGTWRVTGFRTVHRQKVFTDESVGDVERAIEDSSYVVDFGLERLDSFEVGEQTNSSIPNGSGVKFFEFSFQTKSY
jgi:hypothetical protein